MWFVFLDTNKKYSEYIYNKLILFSFAGTCCIKIYTNDMLKKIVLLILPWIAFAYGTFPSKVIKIHHIKMIISNVVLSTDFVQSRPRFKNNHYKYRDIMFLRTKCMSFRYIFMCRNEHHFVKFTLFQVLIYSLYSLCWWKSYFNAIV